MSSQLTLPMRDRDRAVLAAAKVRAACKVVAQELGYKQVADGWGCAESEVSLKLDQKARHYLKPEEFLELLQRDRHGVIMAAVAEVSGYEMPERRRALDPAEKLARLEAQINETLGSEVAELVLRKAGLL